MYNWHLFETKKHPKNILRLWRGVKQKLGSKRGQLYTFLKFNFFRKNGGGGIIRGHLLCKRYDGKQVPKIKNKYYLLCETRTGKKHKKKDTPQIFDIFFPKNCDYKVIKFLSEKNLLVGGGNCPPCRTNAKVQLF
jgi:hypothetical protein